jgi:hypothetical protein
MKMKLDKYWSILVKLHCVHVVEGDPPGGAKSWDDVDAGRMLDNRIVSLSWYRENGRPKSGVIAIARLIAALPNLVRAVDMMRESIGWEDWDKPDTDDQSYTVCRKDLARLFDTLDAARIPLGDDSDASEPVVELWGSYGDQGWERIDECKVSDKAVMLSEYMLAFGGDWSFRWREGTHNPEAFNTWEEVL